MPMRERLPEGLDYAALRAAGVAFAQAASSDNWTDYNEHDPGVTILEQLCYALTDLAYRAGYDEADLFLPVAAGQTREEELVESETALFPGPQILTCDPVTPHDLRTLLYADIEDVANAWLSASPGAPGVWDIAVQPYDVDVSEQYRQDLAQQVRQTYLTHRALCEDLGEIEILKPRKVTIRAEIEIDERQSAADAAAQILFDLEQNLIAAPNYTTLGIALAKGRRLEEIYEGPALKALVDNPTPDERPSRLYVEQFEGIARASQGVRAVRAFAVVDQAGDDIGAFGLTWGDDEFPTIDVQETLNPSRFVLTLDGVRQECDVRRVLESLAHLRYKYHQNADKAQRLASADPYNALPRGVWRPLEDYVSICEQFPRVYGLGRRGAAPLTLGSADAEQTRAVDIGRLKDYLLLFESFLVNHLAQLAHLPKLLRVAVGGDDRTYACASLDRLERELDGANEQRQALMRALDELVRRADPVLSRRARWLDHMLARFGESFDEARWLRAFTLESGGVESLDGEAKRLAAAKAHFLSNYGTREEPANAGSNSNYRSLGSSRGAGADYGGAAAGSGCGLERWARLLSGIDDLIVVEHILLRHRAPGAADDATFLAFKLSVIASARLPDGRAAPRKLVVSTIDDNGPAHIESACFFLEPRDREAFDALYQRWRETLADAYDGASPASPAARIGQLDERSAALRRFLVELWQTRAD